jgi:hypothetical protein
MRPLLETQPGFVLALPGSSHCSYTTWGDGRNKGRWLISTDKNTFPDHRCPPARKSRAFRKKAVMVQDFGRMGVL